MNRNRCIRFENTVISIIALASLALLILNFLPSLSVSKKVQVLLEMGKMVQRAFSVVLPTASLQQMKRKKGGMVYCGPYLMHGFCPLFFWVSPSDLLSYHDRGQSPGRCIRLFQGGFSEWGKDIPSQGGSQVRVGYFLVQLGRMGIFLTPFCIRSNPGSGPAQAEGRIFSTMGINHAVKAGVTVREYKVMEQRGTEIEKGFDRIIQERLQKKSGLLESTLGSVGLGQPMDKRCFYASTAFIVFVPFLGKKSM